MPAVMVIPVVITTLDANAPAIGAFGRTPGLRLIVVGDRRTVGPARGWGAAWAERGGEFIAFERQSSMGFDLPRRTRPDHYARKNAGYLLAIASGAPFIYETDDDNAPLEPGSPWAWPGDRCPRMVRPRGPFVNIYRRFSDLHVWPRGFPLDRVAEAPVPEVVLAQSPPSVGVWQGLADDDPDVDAVHRLVYGRSIRFEAADPVCLPPGAWCPFNSQNTWWHAGAADLMYLPSTVSMRFCDILRGYVAQRLLWEAGLCLGFTGPTVLQRRNPHDLMADFAQEVPMHAAVRPLVELLTTARLPADRASWVPAVYGSLALAGLVGAAEPGLAELWAADVEAARARAIDSERARPIAA